MNSLFKIFTSKYKKWKKDKEFIQNSASLPILKIYASPSITYVTPRIANVMAIIVDTKIIPIIGLNSKIIPNSKPKTLTMIDSPFKRLCFEMVISPIIELTINHAANINMKKVELAPTLNITSSPNMISIIPMTTINPEPLPASALAARRNNS